MKTISMNHKELCEIIDRLERASVAFDGFGCALEVAMIDDELDKYEETEILLRKNIARLRKLAFYPKCAS